MGTAGFGEQSRDAPSSKLGSQLHPFNSTPQHRPGATAGHPELPCEVQRDKETLELQVPKGQRLQILWMPLSSCFLHNNSFFLFSSQSRTHGQSTSLG